MKRNSLDHFNALTTAHNHIIQTKINQNQRWQNFKLAHQLVNIDHKEVTEIWFSTEPSNPSSFNSFYF